ncbi:MAG: glycosyltransferase [Alphaproteobacteria bacterium]|nr:glycosyltransferase [Alphaproteobacteria bacterium]
MQKSLKCYFALTSIDHASEYLNLFDVALKTLRKNTTLSPVVIYDGNTDGETYAIMKKHGVKIIMKKFSQIEALHKLYNEDYITKKFGKTIRFDKILGAFMRLDIPEVEHEDEFVLYTDIDVMFMSDIKLDDFTKLPSCLAAAPQFQKDDHRIFNSGVMLINVPKFRHKTEEIFDMINRGQHADVSVVDQGYLNEACRDVYDRLGLEYNWKPYWGVNENAKIIHLHGMKPTGTIEDSGFKMGDKEFILMFNQEGGLAGYIYYTDIFFKELGKNYDEWLIRHYEYLLNVLDRDRKSHVTSVIIPVYNALEYVQNCIESVLKNYDFTSGEVIVIDDCSTDERVWPYLEELALKRKEIKLLRNESNLGFVKTCNRGMKLSQGGIVVLLNSDTEIPKNFQQKIRRCFDSSLEIGVASPISTNSATNFIPLPGPVSLDEANDALDAIVPRPLYPDIHTAEGFCFAIRREVIDKQGYLDEIYGRGYCEEVDFSFRAVSNGFRAALIDNLYVMHERNKSYGLADKKSLLEANQVILFSRWKNYIDWYLRTHDDRKYITEIEAEMKKRLIVPQPSQPSKTNYRLLGFIPLLQVRRKSKKTIYRLLNFLPIIIIRKK